MTDRTKLLWHSNAPWAPTGYGVQTKRLVPPIAEHYDVACSSFYGLQGDSIEWRGIPVFPGLGDTYGNEYLIHHAMRHFDGDPRGGITVSLMDVWVLEAQMARGLNLACIVPVDHDPAPPDVIRFLRDSSAVPIAMARFGEEKMREAGLDPLYIPHVVDTDVFKPVDKARCRELLGVPEDAFLVGIVAANKGRPSRKAFAQAFQAFKALHDRHPDAELYLHTEMNPNFGRGEDIAAILSSLGIPSTAITAANSYRMTLQPFEDDLMAMIYSAMDVLLNCSLGEGFGVPVLEAQACGTPAIVTDFSAMPEVCGSGWHVECSPSWTGQRSWQAQPDVADMVQALTRAYSRGPAERQEMSDKAREHALKYSIPTVVQQYALPALQEIEARFAEREPAGLAVAA